MKKKCFLNRLLTSINWGWGKSLIYLAVMALATTTCTSEDASEVMNHETTDMRLVFMPYDVEPMTRAAVADYATRLDVWIYEGDTEVQAVHQQSTDDDFASLSVTLEKSKTYTVYAVAHKAAGVATLTNGVVAWPDDKVTHSFWYTATFSPATTTTLNCLMERIVGNFRLIITDEVPDGVTRMTVSMGLSLTRWDIAGYGVNPQERVSTFTPAAGSTPTLSAFVIADGDDPVIYSITVTAYDGENAVIQQRTFSDVPIRAGYRTTYTGGFFTDAAVTMSFTVNDWIDYDTFVF